MFNRFLHQPLIKLVAAAILTFTCLSTHAQNLLDVFQDALENDPTFQQAEATWEATKQALPIALSALLPQINSSANFDIDTVHRNVNNILVADGSFTTETSTISLQQQVLNASLWAQLANANASVKAATANYTAAFQNLIVRTTQAYLNVLQNYDNLRYTLADKRATYRQLVSQQQKFKVGLVAITDVYDAQSQYDTIVAQEIVARNELDDSLEQLQAITGHYYLQLAGLTDKGVPLLPPAPRDINAWVHIARFQSYALLAQQYATKAAYDTILANAANHLPTVAIQGAYQKTITINEPVSVQSTTISPTVTAHVDEEDAFVGVAINLPVFNGGAIVAQTKQARYQYANQAATLELTHRQVVTQTRENYLGIVSAISRVQADVQAIKSAANAVTSTEEGYKVGTRTIVDLLNAMTHLYQTQQQLAVDQYSYISNFVGLKQQAGTLSIQDIREIDAWLAKMIAFKGEYAPTRVRMANGTFSYSYPHHEIPEEEKGIQPTGSSSNRAMNTNIEQETSSSSPQTSTNIEQAIPNSDQTSLPSLNNASSPATNSSNPSSNSPPPATIQTIQPEQPETPSTDIDATSAKKAAGETGPSSSLALPSKNMAQSTLQLPSPVTTNNKSNKG